MTDPEPVHARARLEELAATIGRLRAVLIDLDGMWSRSGRKGG